MARDNIIKGWFTEVNPQWPGIACSLEVEKVLFDEKSDYQHVQIFKSKTFGNVLILDGVIQLTERDEMGYQEMITHLPMMSHPKPEHVLVVGGGDGGVIREVLKHKSVKSVTICEIDKVVIEQSKKHFPTMAPAWDDSRVTVVVQDAAKYMETKEAEGKFDVIVCDSSDPVGPANVLFESPFYRSMYKALKPGGRASTQAESIWLMLDLIKNLLTNGRKIFANAEYATTQVPTYPCGQIGFLLLSKEDVSSSSRPTRGKAAKKRKMTEEDLPSCREAVRDLPKDGDFKYYSTDLHRACFTLPAFAAKVVESVPAFFEKEEAKSDEAKSDAPKDEGKKPAKGRGKKKAAAAEEPAGGDKAMESASAENGKAADSEAAPKAMETS
jgi:spermidine synthase